MTVLHNLKAALNRPAAPKSVRTVGQSIRMHGPRDDQRCHHNTACADVWPEPQYQAQDAN